MADIAYVNGRYERIGEAGVSIEDRGYQFADGIYEVCLVIGGHYWDLDGHLDRMDRSLNELSIMAPMSRGALRIVMREILRRNSLNDALVYIQVSRGAARRNHLFPNPPVCPSIVMTARRFDLDASDAKAEEGVKVITQPDIRWGRVDIKTVGLLPNVLAKQAAANAGAFEAWLMRDGVVTEGGSTNAWLVSKNGELITHPTGHEILGGITRATVMECAAELQVKVNERPFGQSDIDAAAEAFVTSATSLVMPVVAVDERAVGDGAPGPVARRLREAYKIRAKNVIAGKNN